MHFLSEVTGLGYPWISLDHVFGSTGSSLSRSLWGLLHLLFLSSTTAQLKETRESRTARIKQGGLIARGGLVKMSQTSM